MIRQGLTIVNARVSVSVGTLLFAYRLLFFGGGGGVNTDSPLTCSFWMCDGIVL